MSESYKIKALYSNYFADILISYVCLQIVIHLNNKNIVAEVMGLASDHTVNKYKKKQIQTTNGGEANPTGRCIYSDAIPHRLLWKIADRFFSRKQLKNIAEWRFLRNLEKNDIAYFWPGSSPELYKKAKSLGCTTITEQINTLQSTGKKILDKEFAALEMPAAHGITEADVAHDLKIVQLSDYIFSPSPAVTKSLTDVGYPLEKILPTSYGLRKTEILKITRSHSNTKPITAIFVGYICVRKGIHLLLKAWVNSNINGKLKIIGRIAPEVKDLLNDYLKNPTIEHIDYVDDLKPIYENADFFILPSLEEGSPLVTYLALGASLPVIASPMGAGGVITDYQEGFIIAPHNEKALIDAIKKLSVNPSLRKEMSIASGKKALQFTWDKVATQRRNLILEKLQLHKK